MRPSVLNKREQRRAKLEARSWYEIRNATEDVAEVRIYDEIGWFGVTAAQFVADLDEITAPEIVVGINCPGGDVFDGIAIYNALRTHPARITTRVDSLAASIASVIVQAGDHRIVLSSGQMMIHDAWGLSIGNARDMREMAELLDRQSDVIAGIYAARGTGDVAHYRDLMEKDSWFTDEETVAEGLADEVVEPSNLKEAASAKSTALPKNSVVLTEPEQEEETEEEEAPAEAAVPAAAEEAAVESAAEAEVEDFEELELRARALAMQGLAV